MHKAVPGQRNERRAMLTAVAIVAIIEGGMLALLIPTAWRLARRLVLEQNANKAMREAFAELRGALERRKVG